MGSREPHCLGSPRASRKWRWYSLAYAVYPSAAHESQLVYRLTKNENLLLERSATDRPGLRPRPAAMTTEV